MSGEVKAYYNRIAKEYDSSRFNNSYGNFINKQERTFLEKNLTLNSKTLNLGCGTGRFMEYSTDGIDFSEEMLAIAQKNHPDKKFTVSSADNTPFQDNSFDQVICFHVFMHLSKEQTEVIFKEVKRILKPGGVFILDYPSANRRKLTRYKAQNWHGGNDYSKREFITLLRNDWKRGRTKGVLFFPIHRIPRYFRSIFYPMDQLLTISPFKHYSSYLITSLTNSKDA